jgi:hypothetical protein
MIEMHGERTGTAACGSGGALVDLQRRSAGEVPGFLKWV